MFAPVQSCTQWKHNAADFLGVLNFFGILLWNVLQKGIPNKRSFGGNFLRGSAMQIEELWSNAQNITVLVLALNSCWFFGPR